MVKKFMYLTSLSLIIFFLTGCEFKTNTMDDINIYTTNYATEYITKRLYEDHSTIHSIYPNGISIKDYKLTTKQIKDYSNSDLYIFNGLNKNEKSYVNKLRNENNNLKIIDDTISMTYSNGIEELWLDPSNFLMIAQNIKDGFKEYINNYYLNNDINTNYEKLKIETSNLDVKIKQTVANADTKNIVVSNSVFKFLEKYGLKVYVLDTKASDKTIEDVNKMIDSKEIKYIFIMDNEKTNKLIKDLVDEKKITTLNWHSLSNLTENEKNSNQDYFTIMNENISLLRDELYK